MNLKEAEAFFKRFHGHHYHMFHDETKLYREYRIWEDKNREQKWIQELIQEQFDKFYEKSDAIWWRHRNIIDIMHEAKDHTQRNAEKLISLIDELYDLDKKQKILDFVETTDNKYEIARLYAALCEGKRIDHPLAELIGTQLGLEKR